MLTPLILTCAIVFPTTNTAVVSSHGVLPRTDTPVIASLYTVEYDDMGDHIDYRPVDPTDLVRILTEERSGTEPRAACELVGEGGLLWEVGVL